MVSIHLKSQHCHLSPDSSTDPLESQSKSQKAFFWKMLSHFLNYIEKKNPRLAKAFFSFFKEQVLRTSLLDFTDYLKTYSNQDCNIGERIVDTLIRGTE